MTQPVKKMIVTAVIVVAVLITVFVWTVNYMITQHRQQRNAFMRQHVRTDTANNRIDSINQRLYDDMKQKAAN